MPRGEFQMKKFALVALFALVVFGSAFAGTSGTVGLSGTVAPQFELTLPGNYTAGTMNDGASEVNTWTIGNVAVVSNYKNWTISVSSANSGYLVHSTDNTEKVQYTMTLGSLATNQSLGSLWTSAAQARTPKTGSTYALSIKFTASATDFWQTGTYTDTLSVSITHP